MTYFLVTVFALLLLAPLLARAVGWLANRAANRITDRAIARMSRDAARRAAWHAVRMEEARQAHCRYLRSLETPHAAENRRRALPGQAAP